MTIPVPAASKALLPSRRPQEMKKRRTKHRACLELHSSRAVTAQPALKTSREDRDQEKARESRPTEMKATKPHTPACWIKACQPGLLGDTYVPQRLRKTAVPKVQTPMLPASLEIKRNQGQMLLLNVPCHFVKGTVVDWWPTMVIILYNLYLRTPSDVTLRLLPSRGQRKKITHQEVALFLQPLTSEWLCDVFEQ